MLENYKAILLGITFHNPNGGGNLSLSQVIKLENEALDKIYQHYMGLVNQNSLFATPKEGAVQISIIKDLVLFRQELAENKEKEKADRKERALKKEAIANLIQQKQFDSLQDMPIEKLQELLNSM